MGYMVKYEEYFEEEIQKLVEYLLGDVSYFKWLRKFFGGSKV